MYEIVWDDAAKAELARASAFLQRIIVDAVNRKLRYEPDVETRNRKPLGEQLPEVPDAAWELRIREHRALYRIPNARTVRVLRVILKGTGTLTVALGRDEP